MANPSFNIFENFNKSNQSQPHFERHEILTKFVHIDGCSLVDYMPISMRCHFVKTEPDCLKFLRFLNYMEFMYCYVQQTGSRIVDWIYLSVLLVYMFYLFQVLGQLMGKFFCPGINYIARTFRMSQSFAGATILGIANGVAGLFLAFADLGADTVGLYTGSNSFALFSQTIVAGIVLLIRPFHVYRPLHVRDTVFLLTLTTYIEYIMNDQLVDLYESFPLFLFYAAFLVTVGIDAVLIRKLSKDIRRKLKLLEEGVGDEELRMQLEELQNEGVMEILVKDSGSILDIERTRSAFEGKGPNDNLFRQFLESINPIDRASWETSGSCYRFMQAVVSPFVLLFLLLCPRVDYNLPNHGWSKLLNMFTILSGPFFIISVSRMITWKFFGVSIYVYWLIPAIVVIVLVYFFSRTDTPPIFHIGFACFSVIVSLILVRIVALEVLYVIYTVGTASQMSPTLINVTLQAWEGGIGSLIANVILAYRGYPRMSFAACYGGPLFSMPLVFGVRLSYKAITSQNRIAVVHQGPLGITIYCHLFTLLLFSMLGILFARDQGRKSIGVYRILIYPCFLLMALLEEFEVIHGHNTDHTDQRVQMD